MTTQEMNPFEGLKTKRAAVDPAALRRAVGSMLGTPVKQMEYQSTPLHGGTLGDVQLIEGTAETGDGRALPFRIVQKTQKQWERPGDPNSWRREYDLCRSDLHALFTEAFRWPACYHTEESANEVRIWMEYVEGVSGAELTLDNLAQAAIELGRFQGRCHGQAEALRRNSCFSDAEAMQRDFAQWTPDTAEYRWLRSGDCSLPPGLQKMLIDAQAGADAAFQRMRGLPTVLCHRDFWTENIFLSGGRVVVLDWDCAGWGVPGEDIASLIADETPAARIGEYYRNLLPAYYTGLSESMALPPLDALPVREMILFKFGYRLVQQAMYSRDPDARAEAICALDQIRGLPPSEQ